MSATPLQLVVFDLMGTLVIDSGVVRRAYVAALREAGLHEDTDDFAAAQVRLGQLQGRPTLVVLSDVLGDPVAAEESTWAFDDAILAEVASLELVPGTSEVLDELDGRGVHSALTTSFSPDVRKAVLRHFGWEERFAALLSAHGSHRGHPAPDLLLRAILDLRVDSVGQVAIVGDSPPDLEAGNRAGAGLVVGVLSGSHDREALMTAPHTHLIGSVAELIPVLDGPRAAGHRRRSDG